MTENVSFQRVAFSPVGCLSESWRRVRDQYWMFAGLATGGLLLGSAAPFGLLLGPMMCGLYSCYRRKWKGERVKLEHLFDGFQETVLVPSVLATLVLMGATLVLIAPFLVITIAAVFAGAFASTMRDSPAMAAVGPVILLAGVVLWMGLTLLISTFFAFTYPLIVDRKLPALAALRLSVRAVLAHFGRVLLLHVMTMSITLCGLCCCYVGAFLVAPVTLGALMVAYEQIFGLAE